MPIPASPLPTPRPTLGRAVLVTWLVTAAWDFVCASALGAFAYGSSFSRFWQGVASVVLGPTALQMGARGVAVGLVLHLLVALAWSAAFVVALVRSAALQRLLDRPITALGVAAIYGPIIWLVMSFAVIPVATHRLPTLNFRWWVQFVAHVPFVTLPLVFTARRMLGVTAVDTRPRMDAQPTSSSESGSTAPATACLNCEAPLTGDYCAACGQRAVDLTAPTWHLAREALSDATDLDGRVLRTMRAIASPGRLTLEFMRGRRAPYVSPFKLFLSAGAALSTTWVLTRGIDARYYGMSADQSAATYIDTVVRGLLAGCVAVALTSWVLAGGRRRLSDETVFALHITTALSFWAVIIIWLAAAWKLGWTTALRVPPGIPPLPYLLFPPAAAIAVFYVVVAMRRVHGIAWWVAALRTVVLMAVGFAAVTVALIVRLH